MQFASAALAAILAHTAYSHTTVTSVLVNGKDQRDPAPVHGLKDTGMKATGYIRVPENNDPIKNITSANMTCNVDNVVVPKSVSLAAGDQLTFQWHHDAILASDDIMDPTHQGPIMTYVAPAGLGAGDVWVKIAEAGYNTTTKKWATDVMIANKGMVDVIVPPNLAPGDYVFRQEIMALHQANIDYFVDQNQGSQFYMSCVQVTVATGGTTVLPAGVAIPGAYSVADVVFKGLKTGQPETFKIPGPPVNAALTGTMATAVSTNSTTKATKTTKTNKVSSARFRREFHN